MKKIVDRFDKHLIGNLPRAAFPGHIEVIISESDAERAVQYLLHQPILGFDTETRPSFTRGRQYAVALLQVSSRDVCFLFRLNHIGLPQCLVDLLTDQNVTKIGLSWHDDLRMLNRRRKFEAGTFVELQDMSKEMGIVDMSLQKLYANLFGQKISKTQQLSNWEADSLSDAQQLYAATDAWACIQLYEEMTRMQQEGFELEQIPVPEPPAPQPKPEAEEGQSEPKKKKSAKRKKAKAEPKPEPELTPEEQAAREERRRKRQERSEHFRQLARQRRQAAKAKKALQKLNESNNNDQQDNHTEEG